jgi:Gpi18-like mannosyltransferase
MLKSALKEAAWIFVLSRFTIILVSYIGIVLLPLSGQVSPSNCTSPFHFNPCFLAWYHWDAMAYADLAYKGYSFTPEVAFFPLWPLLIHFGGLLLGGLIPVSYYIAGLLLANICFYFALVLLYCLLCEDFEASIAKKALFYLAFYPYALFFFVGYTESFFLLLSVAIFLLLRRGKTLDWWFAGGIGFLASLTRSTGVLLCIPFLILYIRHFWVSEKRDQSRWLQKINALVPIILFPLGIVVYMIYLGYTKGNPFIFQSAEATYFHRHFEWIWMTFGYIVKLLLDERFFAFVNVKNLLDFAFTAFPIVALVWAWKRIPLHYSLYAFAVIIFSISFPLGTSTPLTSQPRYLIVLFPLFAIFALWGKHPRFDQFFISIGPPLLAVFTILFISHNFVA